jgi:hypothetical protein
MGERPGGAGRSGLGALLGRKSLAEATGARSRGPSNSRREPRRIPRCKLLRSSVSLLVPVSFNHAIILQSGPDPVYGTRVTSQSVPWYCLRNHYTPRSGMLSSASLKRLVKLAMQIASVSSTICPSS